MTSNSSKPVENINDSHSQLKIVQERKYLFLLLKIDLLVTKNSYKTLKSKIFKKQKK
jgi:hypothetical protein